MKESIKDISNRFKELSYDIRGFEYYYRDWKVIYSIVSNDLKQMVMADFGLLLSYHYNQVECKKDNYKIVLNGDYTGLEPGGNVEVITDVDRDQFSSFLTQYM